MTKSQERALERIRKLAERHMNDCFNNGEIKKWKVGEHEYFVSVVVEIGGVDDAGTWAEIYCRDRCQLFIGKRGGITYPVDKKLNDGRTKHYTKRFKGYSILQAVCDQREMYGI